MNEHFKRKRKIYQNSDRFIELTSRILEDPSILNNPYIKREYKKLLNRIKWTIENKKLIANLYGIKTKGIKIEEIQNKLRESLNVLWRLYEGDSEISKKIIKKIKPLLDMIYRLEKGENRLNNSRNAILKLLKKLTEEEIKIREVRPEKTVEYIDYTYSKIPSFINILLNKDEKSYLREDAANSLAELVEKGYGIEEISKKVNSILNILLDKEEDIELRGAVAYLLAVVVDKGSNIEEVYSKIQPIQDILLDKEEDSYLRGDVAYLLGVLVKNGYGMKEIYGEIQPILNILSYKEEDWYLKEQVSYLLIQLILKGYGKDEILPYISEIVKLLINILREEEYYTIDSRLECADLLEKLIESGLGRNEIYEYKKTLEEIVRSEENIEIKKKVEKLTEYEEMMGYIDITYPREVMDKVRDIVVNIVRRKIKEDIGLEVTDQFVVMVYGRYLRVILYEITKRLTGCEWKNEKWIKTGLGVADFLSKVKVKNLRRMIEDGLRVMPEERKLEFELPPEKVRKLDAYFEEEFEEKRKYKKVEYMPKEEEKKDIEIVSPENMEIVDTSSEKTIEKMEEYSEKEIIGIIREISSKELLYELALKFLNELSKIWKVKNPAKKIIKKYGKYFTGKEKNNLRKLVNLIENNGIEKGLYIYYFR